MKRYFIFPKNLLHSLLGSMSLMLQFIFLSFFGYIFGYIGLLYVYKTKYGMPPLFIEFRSSEKGAVGLYRNQEKYIELFVWTIRFHEKGFVNGIFFTVAHEYCHHIQYQTTGKANEYEAERWAQEHALQLFAD